MTKATRKKEQPIVSVETQPAEVITEKTNIQEYPKPEPTGTTQPPAQEEPKAPIPTQPPVQPPVTLQIVEARFKVELSKLNYEAGLQAITSYKITEENIGEAQGKLTAARKLLREFDDIKDTFKKPVLERGRMIDAAYNSLKKPLQDEIAKKQADLNKVAAEQERKRQEAEKETKRIDGIKKDMDDTLMDHSQTIAAATTTDKLIVLEKLLGSQKANKARFMEFLPDFIQRAGELTPLIKKQKEAIKELEDIAKRQQEAEAKGDDAAFIQLEEQKEQVTARIEETQVVVQETAISQAVKVDTSVEVGRPVFTTVDARRTSWEAEISNEPKSLEKAFKAGLLDCTINKEKIKTIIGTLKSAGTLKDKSEITIDGIRYFEKKLY